MLLLEDQRERRSLQSSVEALDAQVLELLQRRAELLSSARTDADEILALQNCATRMMASLLERNAGRLCPDALRSIFGAIFRATQGTSKERNLLIRRRCKDDNVIVKVRDTVFGASPVTIAGPCAIESLDQMRSVARALKRAGLSVIRGGAFKPRTSPYAFQGLGLDGLKILKTVAEDFELVSITEVMDTRCVQMVADYADVLQIGARNMQNFELLKEVGRIRKPVILKRGLSATLEEFMLAAEYIASEGNSNIILCERGIRTFETQTRFTLDISAIPILRDSCALPVMVDVSHAAGRLDILAPLTRAALAAGAQGVMVEVHPCPSAARSDAHQQLDIPSFLRFLEEAGLRAPLAKVRSTA